MGTLSSRILPAESFRAATAAATTPQPDIVTLFDSLRDLDTLQKEILKRRYTTLYTDFQARSRRYAIVFYTLRIIVTVGSLLVPALLSIQYTNVSLQERQALYEITIYWFTWFLSLAVTTSNGIYTLFKVDKKYYYLITAFELLKSEAWQYLELTGRYASRPGGPRSTHLNQYLYFSHALEKHKLKQVEEEYYKLYDQNSEEQGTTGTGGGAAGSGQSTTDHLAPPTPDKSLLEISKTISPETLITVNSILTSLGKTADPETVITRIQAAARRASLSMLRGGNGGPPSPLKAIVQESSPPTLDDNAAAAHIDAI